jgi:hypothetical protein
MPHFKKAALALAIASSITLVGCSNSSSSGSGDEVTEPSAQTVSGAAVKGVLKDARVTVYELRDSGERLGEVGSATTNDDGEYEAALTSAYQGGLLEIEVTSVPGQTRMVCDASACGTVQKDNELEPPANFKLSAIVSKQSGSDKVSAPVTAWSSMAASRARVLAAEGMTFSASSRQAIAEVNQVAGFDVSRTSAKAINKLEGASSGEQQAAVMNAVVAEIVFGGGDLAENLDNFIAALDDGQVGNEGDSFKAKDLSEKTSGVLRNVEAQLDEEARGNLDTQVGEYDSAGDEGLKPVYDQDLDLDGAASQQQKIDAYKKFVTQVRTWAKSMDDTAASLQDETSPVSVALNADVDTIRDVFVQAGVTGDLISKLLDGVAEQVSMTRSDIVPTLNAGSAHRDSIDQTWVDEEDPSVSGSLQADIEITDSDSGLVIGVNGSVSQTEGETRNFDLVLDTTVGLEDLIIADSPEDPDSIKGLLAQNNVRVTGTITDGSNLERALLDLTVALELTSAVENDTGVTDTQLEDRLSAIALNGTVVLSNPNAAAFTGTIAARVVSMSGSAFEKLDEPLSMSNLSLSGDFTAESGRTFSLSASLNNRSAQRFNLFTYLDYNNTTSSFDFQVERAAVEQFVEFDESASEYSFFIVSSGGSCNDSGFGERIAFSDWFDSDKGVYDGNCNVLDDAENAALDELVSDQLAAAVGNDVATASTLRWLEVSGSSSVDQAWVNTDIEFPNLETADNFVNASFTVSSGVSLVDLPRATVTATLNRSSFSGASVTANVKWNSGTYSLRVATDDIMSDDSTMVSLTFSNPQGYSLKAVAVENAEGNQTLTGNAFINGEDIGDVTLRNGIPVITYPNGSTTEFESLF